ncbi:MAG: hypothetical protein FJ304_12835 [Planctomycetes bacterium]|nr:hypothetical protein [Planctomycetota bacterium]
MSVSIRRVARFLALTAVAAVVLVAAARFGLSRFLASERGKTMVAARLGSTIGMPVEVSQFDVGDDTSSFRFRVMDPTNPKAEVLNVPRASADVTATDLVTGRVAPSALSLTGAALTLRVNSAGQLTTPLPAFAGGGGTVPAVAVEGGRVCIRQEGRPEFAVGGINLKIEPAGEVLAIRGSVTDPKWGAWAVRGELRRDTRTGWVELTCPDAPLDAELLGTIPFAPAGLFADVPTGERVGVTLRLTIGADRDVQPAVELRHVRTVFGFPVPTTFHLTPGSERFYFAR